MRSTVARGSLKSVSACRSSSCSIGHSCATSSGSRPSEATRKGATRNADRGLSTSTKDYAPEGWR
eukprot:449704-Pleurochrysis_carterae.AAC.3